jgi:lipopolysaccharide biosynthesis glycosyltransferase
MPVENMFVRLEFHNDIREGMKNPVIIHFITALKPWYIECKHPYKDVWLFVKQQTVWKNVKQQYLYKQDRNIFNALKVLLLCVFGRRFFDLLHLRKASSSLKTSRSDNMESVYKRLSEKK